MVAYVVIRDWEDIEGIFENRADAEAYIAANVPKEEQIGHHGCWIQEFDMIESGTWSHKRYRKAFIFEYNEDRDVFMRFGDYYSITYIEKVVEYDPDGYWSGVIPYQGEITDRQCEKIAKKLIEFEKAKMRGEVD